MINFYLPGLWTLFQINDYFSSLLKTNPDFFYPNIKIGAIYGIFPNAAWGGGRVIQGPFNQQDINNMITIYNMKDIPVRYTFTNNMITPDMLTDKYCNYLMDVANNGFQNEVLVTSPLLEEYLRNKYPNFKYISSVTKRLDKENFIQSLNDYDMSVMITQFNKDIDFLQSIPPELKHKVEILINSTCDPQCPRFLEHYTAFSNCQITSDITELKTFNCERVNYTFFDRFKIPSTITAEDLYSIYYQQYGFTNFKIEGRSIKLPEVIESLLYYCVRPEYKDKVRLLIYNHLF